jgi:hypothetical protein
MEFGGAMNGPAHCIEALRHLASDETLNRTDRLLAAEQTINRYASDHRDRLAELDKEIVRQPPAAGDDHFWSALHDLISHRLRNLSADD